MGAESVAGPFALAAWAMTNASSKVIFDDKNMLYRLAFMVS
jgi:hypothetical protein